MSASAMDQSLDQLIASKPRNGRRGLTRRGSARAQVLGKPTTSPATRARANAPTNGITKSASTPATTPTDKIIVSNLPTDVNEAQVKELFNQTVGPLKEVTLHYDVSGRSKGIASVSFQRKGDGAKAFQQYNNRLIDGKKPMKIEIVVAPVQASLASRVAPAVPAAAGNVVTAKAGGRGRRVRGGRVGRKDRPVKSAADLDAEMEDYTASNAPPAAPAAT